MYIRDKWNKCSEIESKERDQGSWPRIPRFWKTVWEFEKEKSVQQKTWEWEDEFNQGKIQTSLKPDSKWNIGWCTC